MKLLDEFKQKMGFREDQEVAAYLGKHKSTVSKWRDSGELPLHPGDVVMLDIQEKKSPGRRRGYRGQWQSFFCRIMLPQSFASELRSTLKCVTLWSAVASLAAG